MAANSSTSVTPRNSYAHPLLISGSTIGGRYEVLRPLGVGGFGVVGLCHDLQQQRLVALKTFQSKYLSDRASRELFLRESGIWISLGIHPNIVQAYEINQFDHGLSLYIVLEPISNPAGQPSLHQWTHNGPLDMKQALELGLDIIRGMRYATERIPGLVHRDLKPANILVGGDGRARVSDFGLAATLRSRESPQSWMTDLPESGGGTLLYMSPEHFAGQPLDQRADCFAFGCILYETLLGSTYLSEQLRQGSEVVRQRIHQGCLRQIPIGLPEQIATLLQACLAPRRDERPENWQALEAMLVTLYRQLTGMEVPDPSPQLMLGPQYIIAGSLLNLARGYFDIGKLTQAEQMAEQALASAQQARHPLFEIQGIELIAKIADARGDFGQAWKQFNEAFTLACNWELLDVQKTIANFVGLMLLDRGNLEAAQSWLQEALRLAQQLEDSNDKVTITSNLGLIAHRQQNSEHALKVFSHLLDISRTTQNRHHELIALMNIAYVLSELGDQGGAIPLFLKSHSLALQIGRFDRLVEITGNLGSAYNFAEDYDRGIEVFKEHLALACELGDREEEQRAWDGLGYSLLYSSNYKEAMKIANDNIRQARVMKNKNAEAKGHFLLAQVHHRLSDTEKAMQNFAIAVHLFGEAGNRPEQEITETIVAQIHHEVEEGSAERAEALRMAKTNDQQLPQVLSRKGVQSIAEMYRNTGNLYYQAGRCDLAQARLLEGLQIAQNTHLADEEYAILEILVVVCRKLKQWEDARVYSEQQFALVRTTQRPDTFLPLFDNLAHAYEHTERWDDAEAILIQALHIAYEFNLAENYLHFACRIGFLHLNRSKVDAALPFVQIANEVGNQIGPVGKLAGLNQQCGESLAMAGRRTDAIPYVSRAERLFCDLGDTVRMRFAHNLVTAFTFRLPTTV